MEKKLKYLIPVIIITTLVFPKPASAFIGTGIFDYFDTALEGIEEFSGPVAKFIFTIFLYYIVGLGSLFISSSLLQLVLKNISWLSVTNNPMVLSGWKFVAGITNMFFILIFVFIALATILKIETLAAKKLLPKLLIVALLVNFSLIFVGVIIDVSNIFYATIIGGDTDLIPDIFSVLTKGGEETLLMIITLVLTLLITFIIPFTSPFAQMGLVILIVATGFIGHLLIWLVQGMMFFMMSGILLVYVFLFAARIFVLQLLAMVAPIAFLCSVLPQTKKYWDDWLKMVVEWNTFGVVTLLFLVVGLRGANAIIPPAAISGISFSGATLFWGTLPAYFTYYFFLFVYLVALLYFSQKYSPQMASMLIGQAKAMGGMIYAKGLKPMGGMLKDSYKEAVKRQPEAEKELERRRAKGKKARLLAFRVGAGKVLTRPAKWAARGRGTTLEREQAKAVEKDMAKLESTFGKDIASAIKVYGGKTRFKGAMRAALPLYLAKMKGGEGIDKFEEMVGDEKKFEKKIRQSVDAITGDVPHMLKDFVKHKRELIGDPEVGKLIQKTMVETNEKGELKKDKEGKFFKDKDIRLMVEKKVTINGEKIEDLVKRKEWDKIIEEATNKKAVGALRVSDIETLSSETVGDEKFQEMVARYRTDWNFVRRLATEKGVDFAEIQSKIENDTALGKALGKTKEERINEIAKTNSYFIKAPYTSAGKHLMRPWYGIEDKDAADDRLAEVRGEKEVKGSEEIGRRIIDQEKELDRLRETLETTPAGDIPLEQRKKSISLPKEITKLKEEFKKRKERERNEVGTKVKELKLTSDEKARINGRVNEILKDDDWRKIFEREADFESITPSDRTFRMYAEEKAKTELMENIIRERKTPSKKPVAPPVKKEEKLPSWEKEFLNKINQYQKEVDKYNKSLEEGDKEIEEIDNKLKSLGERLDSHSKGEIILSKIERKDIPRETIRLGQEKDNKLLRRSNIKAKIEKREKIVDEIGKEMKSWEKRPKEEYREEKELVKLSLRGALKFIPSEIKESLKEGREARDQLSRSLADYESTMEEKRVLQKKIELLEVDVNLRKEEEKEFGAGVKTKRRTALKGTELKNLQGRLDNIIEKRISALRNEINKQKTILTEKKSDIKKETDRVEMEREEKETEKILQKKLKKKEKEYKELRKIEKKVKEKTEEKK